jgi:hypothetical protein
MGAGVALKWSLTLSRHGLIVMVDADTRFEDQSPASAGPAVSRSISRRYEPAFARGGTRWEADYAGLFARRGLHTYRRP